MRSARLSFLAFALTFSLAIEVRGDLVTLTNGEEIVGEIVKQDRRNVTLKTMDGKRTVSLKEVRSIQTDAKLREIHRDRRGLLREFEAEELRELAQWLERVGLEMDARGQLEEILIVDSDDESARRKLGYVRKDGRWHLAEDGGDGVPKSETSDLPGECEALIPLTAEADEWFRWIGYKRLRLVLEGYRSWLHESLEDPASSGYGAAIAELGWTPPTGDEPDPDSAEEIQDRIETRVRERLVKPLGDRYRAARASLIEDVRETYVKVAKVFPSFSPASRKKKEAVLQKWQEARRAALDFINDSSQYYKLEEQDGDGLGFAKKENVVGQDIVDAKVEAVRKIWRVLDPAIKKEAARFQKMSAEKARSTLEQLSLDEYIIAEMAEFLAYLGEEPGGELEQLPLGARCFLHYRAEDFAVAWELYEEIKPWERAVLRRVRDNRAWKANEATAKRKPKSGLRPTSVELKQADILNTYRMMLGLPVLEIHPNLVKATRGHSEEMARLGYFAHESPTPGRETPDDRARLAGYEPDIHGM